MQPKMKPEKLPQTEIITITPQMAQQWLEFSNFDNRRIEERAVDKIARDIKAGKWVFDGNPIRFDKNDNVIDGQHRLRAIIRAGKSIEALIIRNIEDKAKNTIDTGRSRSTADILHFNGQINTAALSSVGRLVVGWEEYQGNMSEWSGKGGKKQLSTQELLEAIRMRPRIINATQMAVSLRNTQRLLGISVTGLCYYIFSKIDNITCDNFFQQLEKGTNIPAGSAILALRNVFIVGDSRLKIVQGGGSRRWAAYKTALAIKAWNAYRKNKPILILRYVQNQEIYPEPI